MDFGPKSIFSSKDAANWRKSVDSFFVGKTSYYMVTPATSFFDADSNLEKLVGGGGSVYKCRGKSETKNFLFRPGHSCGLGNFCHSQFVPRCSRNWYFRSNSKHCVVQNSANTSNQLKRKKWSGRSFLEPTSAHAE